MGGSNTGRRSFSDAKVWFIKCFGWNEAVLAVPTGIPETRFGRDGFAAGVVGMTGDGGVGGPMGNQPENW